MESRLFEPQNLSRVAPLLALFSLGLLLLRFLTVVVIADRFGRTELADVLFIAQLIPISLFMQNRKAIMASFVPVYTDYIVHGTDEEVWHLTNQFANLTLVSGVALALIYSICSPWLIRLLSPGFSTDELRHTVRLTLLLAPSMLFFMIYSLEESLLYSFRHFTTTSWTAILGGVGGLLGVVLLADRYGVFGYGYGCLAGFFLQCVLPLPLFWKYRKKFHFSLNRKDPGLLKVYALLGPVYVLSLLLAVIHASSRAMASTLGPGSVSAFQYCGTFVWILPVLMTNTVMAPLFPIIAEKVVRREMQSLKDMIRKGMQVLVFLTTPMIVAMILLRLPIVRLVFERGEFSIEDSRLTAYTLIFYAPLILAMAVNLLLVQVLINLGRVKTVAKMIFLLCPLNVGFCLGFMRIFDVGGVALSLSLVFFLLSGACLFVIRLHAGRMGMLGMVGSAAKVLAASALAAVPAWFLVRYIEAGWAPGGALGRMACLSVESGVYFALYGVLAWLLRMEEVPMLVTLLKTKKARDGDDASRVSLPMMGG